jgi:predicted ABC-class ATPase
MSDILEYALGNGADLGLDEEGFLVALVADGHRLQFGVTVRLCTRDHPPPHVHIEVKGEPNLKLRMDLRTGELLGNGKRPRACGHNCD